MASPEMKELGVVRLATPCPMKWGDMRGDARVRFCARCELNVFNLSGMTSHEARVLFKAHQGRLCVRFWARPDGTVVTRDCPVGVRLRRWKWFAAMAAVVNFVIGFGAWLAGQVDELRPVSQHYAPLDSRTGGKRMRPNYPVEY